MMKTKKDIQFHLNNTAYNKIGSHKIVAFLLGKDILKKGEKINFKEAKVGEQLHTFDYFYNWFASVDSKILFSKTLATNLLGLSETKSGK